MPRPPSPLLSLLLLAILAPSAGIASQDKPSKDEAWQALRDRLSSEAHPAFEALLRNGDESPETALGRAVSLLNRQPRTRDNVARADEQLAVLERQPGDIGVHARLLRARLADVHLFEPDLPLAARRYEELVAAAPAHPLAQASVPKLIRLRIYQLGDDPLAALAAAEDFSATLTDRAARRDYHVIMARSYLFFRTAPERALAHLSAAHEAGHLIPAQASSTLVSIAELALELGRHDLARRAYSEFLQNHPRDQRAYMVRQRLVALALPPAPER